MTRRRSNSEGRQRRDSGGHGGYEPQAVYHLAEHVKRRGVDLGSAIGPWRAARRRVRKPGRTSAHAIPVITNQRTELVMESAERAADVAGLLNWCGVHDLEPVPELRPPAAGQAEAQPEAQP